MANLPSRKALLLSAAIPLLLTACVEGDDGDAGLAGKDAQLSNISIDFLARTRNPSAGFDESAAEIVSYDATSQQLFVVNAQSGQIDIFDFTSPEQPSFNRALNVAEDIANALTSVASSADLGAANSVDVDVASNTLAVAIEADNKQAPGYVAFYQASDGSFLSAVQVGALPDMVTFTPDGNTLLVANEGEPSSDYSVDPEGSVSVIDLSNGAGALSQADVRTAGFSSFNGTDLGDVRITGPDATVAQDLEPEYITVSGDGSTAYVALQENNAIAEIDIANASVSKIWSLGSKNHRLRNNALDAADNDDVVNIRNWPIYGLPMPDAIASYEVNGTQYIVTANEGDAREYFDDSITTEADCNAAGGFDFDADDGCLIYIDEMDLEDLVDAGAIFNLPSADIASYAGDFDQDGDVDFDDLNTDDSLARLAIVTTEGEDNGCDTTDGQAFATGASGCSYSELYSFGTRSFSIYKAATGERVFDSGDDFETITAERLGDGFNASNDDNNDFDSRSDAKGPEPEAVALGAINGRQYAFIGLERVGGVMVYDISEPEAARFVQYLNTRDFSQSIDDNNPSTYADLDLGPESIEFISADDSPSGQPLLVVGHEVSGTVTVLQINVSLTQ